MKIINVEILPLKLGEIKKNPCPSPSFYDNGFIIIKLYSDEGIIGYGEPNPYFINLVDLKKSIEKIIPLIINKNPLDLLDYDLYKICSSYKPKTNYVPVAAGLSQAIWDLIGKSKDLPVYSLLNKNISNPKKIKTYASGGMLYEWNDPKILIDEVFKIKEMGFKIWKMRPPLPEEASHIERTNSPPNINFKKTIALIELVRNTIGEDLDIIIDFGCRIKSINEAITIINEMSNYNLLFIEEPIYRKAEDYKALRDQIDIPISGGESLYNIDDFQYWLELDSYDIIQPDANLLGINRLFNIIELSKKRKKECILHNWTNSINCSANLNVAIASENISLIEYNIIDNPLNDNLFYKSIKPKNGYISVNDSPGLGLEIREDFIDQYYFDL